MECHVTAIPSGSVRWSRPGFNLGELLKGETVKPPSYHVSISTDGTTIAKTPTTVIPPQRVKDPGGASVLGCLQHVANFRQTDEVVKILAVCLTHEFARLVVRELGLQRNK